MSMRSGQAGSPRKSMSSVSVVQTPIIVRTVAELRRQVKIWKQAGERIAFVPTMGNLHAGHLSLVASVNQPGIRRVVSIFVNPMQFGENEDFGEYPRTFDEDVRKLAAENVDMVFAPGLAEIYPQGTGNATAVEVPGLSGILEGEIRPGFFRGVATVVNKLFNIVQPDIAVFGEKDYQQLLVIRQMVRDLAMPVEIRSVATQREPDGLAMSSRNNYLNEEQRIPAAAIHRSLRHVVQAMEAGETAHSAVVHASQELEQQGFLVDYIVVRRQQDLAVPEEADRALVTLVAVRLGPVRLIDNMSFTLKQ